MIHGQRDAPVARSAFPSPPPVRHGPIVALGLGRYQADRQGARRMQPLAPYRDFLVIACSLLGVIADLPTPGSSVRVLLIDEYEITWHATVGMKRRGIDTGLVHRVLTEPEQWFNPRPDRVVLQSRVPMGSPETVYLVRVVVDLDRRPPQVVTAYRTSKILKYWRPGP